MWLGKVIMHNSIYVGGSITSRGSKCIRSIGHGPLPLHTGIRYMNSKETWASHELYSCVGPSRRRRLVLKIHIKEPTCKRPLQLSLGLRGSRATLMSTTRRRVEMNWTVFNPVERFGVVSWLESRCSRHQACSSGRVGATITYLLVNSTSSYPFRCHEMHQVSGSYCRQNARWRSH